MKVLIVDDLLINRTITCYILEKHGHYARAVDSGYKAIYHLSREDFDLVLMDIHMPEMDGVETARIIRSGTSIVRCHEIPIVAFTANARQFVGIMDLQKAGMNGYLTKPVKPDELIAIVEQLCMSKPKHTLP